MRTIVIGDIHGCYYTMISLLEKIQYDQSLDDIIFVGDYIDRGKHSFEVVEYLINLQKSAKSCTCLLGNHEHMAHTDFGLWIYNGGETTLRSYALHNVPRTVHHEWFKSLPLIHETENFICCHAGLPFTKTSDNNLFDIVWDRSWIKTKTEPNEKTVIFGHTPSKQLAYKALNGNICVDTACVYGYQLCAMIISADGTTEFVYENKKELD